MSDSRGLGICGVHYHRQVTGPDHGPDPSDHCVRGVWGGPDVCVSAVPPNEPIPEYASTTCVCVVFRGAPTSDGLSDFGYPTTVEGCRAYRDRYPDSIECVVDRDWHPLP